MRNHRLLASRLLILNREKKGEPTVQMLHRKVKANIHFEKSTNESKLHRRLQENLTSLNTNKSDSF